MKQLFHPLNQRKAVYIWQKVPFFSGNKNTNKRKVEAEESSDSESFDDSDIDSDDDDTNDEEKTSKDIAEPDIGIHDKSDSYILSRFY